MHINSSLSAVLFACRTNPNSSNSTIDFQLPQTAFYPLFHFAGEFHFSFSRCHAVKILPDYHCRHRTCPMVLIYYIGTWENRAFEKQRQMIKWFICLYLLNYISDLRRIAWFSIGHSGCGRRTIEIFAWEGTNTGQVYLVRFLVENYAWFRQLFVFYFMRLSQSWGISRETLDCSMGTPVRFHGKMRIGDTGKRQPAPEQPDTLWRNRFAPQHGLLIASVWPSCRHVMVSMGRNMMTFYPAEGLQKPAAGQRTSYDWLQGVRLVRLYRRRLAWRCIYFSNATGKQWDVSLGNHLSHL